jgi:hypothetical protein
MQTTAIANKAAMHFFILPSLFLEPFQETNGLFYLKSPV